ncbi:hypothetical protein BDR22DRAFT_884920 [Usnea florida]
MKSMSISKDLRRQILNPSYKSIRITKTPREWVLETISERWLELLSLDDVVLHGSNQPPKLDLQPFLFNALLSYNYNLTRGKA